MFTQEKGGLGIVVHPHACGEYGDGWGWNVYPDRFTPTPVGNIDKYSYLTTEFAGSPPRLWGIYKATSST